MENKITEDELKNIQEQQKKINDIVYELGFFETRKHALLHELADVNGKVEETKKDLEDKYGPININVEDGTYTPIEKEEEETPVAAV